MSSWNNRRRRSLHRRHAQTRARMCQRISALQKRAHDPQSSAEERKPLLKRLGRAVYVLEMFDHTFTDNFPREKVRLERAYQNQLAKARAESVEGAIRGHGRPGAARPGTARRILETKPVSLVQEKQEPKVHGVNAQHENRSRPKAGGARGGRRS